jgi:hypothetical protein
MLQFLVFMLAPMNSIHVTWSLNLNMVQDMHIGFDKYIQLLCLLHLV